ncbi:hypothetical protein [Clostridium perfringens]|uniref:Uncharacterized protein n=1 Tax=Clostridium perfringens TaxID=1502 RepID=A0A133NAQ9_CLOPF|nr:hypothetical protein [Clostridium perfringens]ELU5588402.1 hypothetical protein [Clostridium perfringens]KXA13386.1 hypothetical protein HMPREF3222_00848 [Clostridium perfringens]MBS5919852.1 hypothetical protein [Clostridium perfringens]
MSYTKNDMNMYVGKYRVVCEFCRETLKPCKEDNYIYCSNKGQIYRFNDEVLVYYREGKNIAKLMIKNILEKGIEVISDNSTRDDIMFKFYEKDIDKIAKIVRARTVGANIKPTSKRNLKLFKWFNDNEDFYIEKGLYSKQIELSEAEREELRNRMIKTMENMA